MTKQEIADMVRTMNFPWRLDYFSETPAPPYVVYYYPAENDVYADDSNYVNKRQLHIELYTKKRDSASESTVETKLKNAGLTWYKSTDFLNDEKLFLTVYESEVIING